MKIYWGIGLALVVAIALARLIQPTTHLGRLSNLDLEATGLPETFLMFSKSNPDRGYVVNRRDSTVRRFNRKQPGRKWDLRRIPLGEDIPLAWLVMNKNRGKGTILFVPVEAVEDWSYPAVYSFVRDRHPELQLPRVVWTQLYVNRIYSGLYLRVHLPFDPRKRDGGSGIRRQLLCVEDGSLSKVDTRFDDSRGIYETSLADGYFPELDAPSPVLAWLAPRAPTRGATLLMSNVEPFHVTLLPLPVWLPDLFEALHGRRPVGFQDGRYRRWTRGEWRTEAAAAPFDETELEELAAAFDEYRATFRKALRAHDELHQRRPPLSERMEKQQAAIDQLMPRIGAL